MRGEQQHDQEVRAIRERFPEPAVDSPEGRAARLTPPRPWIDLDDPKETVEERAPRIYVASLTDYNRGFRHGDWIRADQDEIAIHDGILEMLGRSPTAVAYGTPAEEWAIHDCDGFNGLHIDEQEGLDFISRIGLGIREHGIAFAHYATVVSSNEDLDAFSERYQGEWRSVTDYAESVLEQMEAPDCLNGLPEWLQPYVKIDAAAFGRDLALGGDIHTSPTAEGGVYVWTTR